MLHIWQIGAYAKICIKDMFFWSVNVWADTFTSNEVKNQTKKRSYIPLTRDALIENPYFAKYVAYDKLNRPILCKVSVLELYIYIFLSVQNYL